MTAPERIWIDKHGGNWSPVSGGTQDVEYIRADLAPDTASVAALVEAAVAMRDELALFQGWSPLRFPPSTKDAYDNLRAALAAMKGQGNG